MKSTTTTIVKMANLRLYLAHLNVSSSNQRAASLWQDKQQFWLMNNFPLVNFALEFVGKSKCYVTPKKITTQYLSINNHNQVQCNISLTGTGL
jgi:hypothetical protein